MGRDKSICDNACFEEMGIDKFICDNACFEEMGRDKSICDNHACFEEMGRDKSVCDTSIVNALINIKLDCSRHLKYVYQRRAAMILKKVILSKF